MNILEQNKILFMLYFEFSLENKVPISLFLHQLIRNCLLVYVHPAAHHVLYGFQ
jgi:hypothetical protein